MFDLLFCIVHAEGEAASSAAVGGPQSIAASIMSFAPLILMFALLYVIMIRPQKKKEKALREKISKMVVGDKVTSIGGIVGKVSKIKDEYVIVETGNIGTADQKSYIKFEKTAIKDIQTKISN